MSNETRHFLQIWKFIKRIIPRRSVLLLENTTYSYHYYIYCNFDVSLTCTDVIYSYCLDAVSFFLVYNIVTSPSCRHGVANSTVLS